MLIPQSIPLLKSWLLLSSILLCAVQPVHAGPPVLFISAFAPGADGGIHAFEFDSAHGTLSPLSRTTDVKSPFFLALSRDSKFLYATYSERFGGKEDEQIASYSLDGRSGRLQRINNQSSHGRATCYVEVDATGTVVLTANYSSGTVASLPVSKDGHLAQAASFIQHPSEDAAASAEAGVAKKKLPNAHSIVPSPDNRFALAADLGVDKIFIYKLDPVHATLTPNPAQPFAILPQGSGPRHLLFEPSGRNVYVINEINSTLSVFAFDPAAGTLRALQTLPTIPPDFSGKNACADLKLTPNGKFLYGTNRGHDSICIFSVAPDGTLERAGMQPSLGKGPQNLLLTPDGKWLLCANMAGNNVAVFALDSSSGQLTPKGDPIPLPHPSCIRWLP